MPVINSSGLSNEMVIWMVVQCAYKLNGALVQLLSPWNNRDSTTKQNLLRDPYLYQSHLATIDRQRQDIYVQRISNCLHFASCTRIYPI